MNLLCTLLLVICLTGALAGLESKLASIDSSIKTSTYACMGWKAPQDVK